MPVPALQSGNQGDCTAEQGRGWCEAGMEAVPLAALSSVVSTAAPWRGSAERPRLLCGRVSADLSMDSSQLSGSDQSRSQQRREDGGGSMICALTLLPGPKNHLVVLTGLHHPCAGAEPQLSARLNSSLSTHQPLLHFCQKNP